MHFSSWYSLRMFELLSAFKDTGIWWVSIDEFRALMNCEKKYPNQHDMLKKTLTEPLQELESTDLAFTYAQILETYSHARGRKPIITLEFRLKKSHLKNHLSSLTRIKTCFSGHVAGWSRMQTSYAMQKSSEWRPLTSCFITGK
jgi:plasmid replication initiation protein